VSTELSTLLTRLAAAQRRLADASPYGPEWDAARAAVEELSAKVEQVRGHGHLAKAGRNLVA
jgi:hypothetical protein